jgi:hypothetical protein
LLSEHIPPSRNGYVARLQDLSGESRLDSDNEVHDCLLQRGDTKVPRNCDLQSFLAPQPIHARTKFPLTSSCKRNPQTDRQIVGIAFSFGEHHIHLFAQ